MIRREISPQSVLPSVRPLISREVSICFDKSTTLHLGHSDRSSFEFTQKIPKSIVVGRRFFCTGLENVCPSATTIDRANRPPPAEFEQKSLLPSLSSCRALCHVCRFDLYTLRRLLIPQSLRINQTQIFPCTLPPPLPGPACPNQLPGVDITVADVGALLHFTTGGGT